MDSNFPSEPTAVSVSLPETRTLVSSVMALLDIARLEIDQDRAIAEASIVRACELLRVAVDSSNGYDDSSAL
jgi:hypothetical protein